jgi:DNA modification methylase
MKLISSHPGDLVLDPFCGCGTTIDAAEKLGLDGFFRP